MVEIKEKAKILMDIAINPLAILPYIKIEEPGELAVGYKAWEHLVDFFLAIERYKLIDLIKSKKIGISWALALLAFRRIYTRPGWNVLEFSQGQLEAQELLSKTKKIYNNLPDWMKFEDLGETKPIVCEPNSMSQFGFKHMKSKITAYPSTESAGIGETGGTVIHDESDFHDFYEINLSHTRATVADTKGGELISVSTVDKTKPESYFKQHWKEAYAGKNGFKALFYGVFSRPSRDQAFYEQIVKENESTPWVVGANYPRTIEEALSPITTQSCFKKESLDRLWENRIEKPETRQGFIYILYPPAVGTQYVAGADVGEGVGLDYSSLDIIGKRGLSSEVVAKIYSNEIATDLFAYECDKLCREYFNCLLAVENNAIGVAVLNKLVELSYPNLFYSDTERKKAGWTTGERNKQIALIELIESINNSSLITRFTPQIKEMMEYQWVKGKPMPTGRTHGDTVISLMIANQMLKQTTGTFKPSFYIRGKRIF